MAFEDLKKDQHKLVCFATGLEQWIEDLNLNREDLLPDPLFLNWKDEAELKQLLYDSRMQQRRLVYQEAGLLKAFITDAWAGSRIYGSEGPLTFLRLVYNDFLHMETITEYTGEEVSHAFYTILDILQDAIFECSQADFEISMIDYKYLIREHQNLLTMAERLSTCSSPTEMFSPFPEQRSVSIKARFGFFLQRYGARFYSDRLLLSPDNDILFRIVSRKPTVEIARLTQRIVRDLVKLTWSVFPESREVFTSDVPLAISKYQRQDFLHVTSDGRYFYLWFRIHAKALTPKTDSV
jgi:hypothetical protein